MVLSTDAREKNEFLEQMEGVTQQISSWNKLITVVAVMLRLKRRLLEKVAKRKSSVRFPYQPIDTLEKHKASLEVARLHQQNNFETELKRLRKDKDNKSSQFRKLAAFLDTEGVIRVGGRTRDSDLTYEQKFPIIINGKALLAQRIISHCHSLCKHQGRETTLYEIRTHGFWITGAREAIYKVISSCVMCIRFRGKPQVQLMADLPSDRLHPTAPFTYAGMDVFGPYHVKQGRSTVKRYGLIFTYLYSRAVHLEMLTALGTNEFMNGYRRMTSRRGPVRELRCDNGTNFTGTSNELNKERASMNKEELRDRLAQHHCDMVSFNFNPPLSSHMGGSWERLIRSVRNVMNVILRQYAGHLDDDLLTTFLCEAEAIVNSRPLAVNDVTGADSIVPISPAMLLTLKPRIAPPLPGRHEKSSVYSRSRWRRVQHLAEQFWHKWQRDYLPSLQVRRKWNTSNENLKQGDIVLIVEDQMPRGEWPVGIIDDVRKSADSHVRSVSVRFRGRVYERPIHKLILIIQGDSPVEELECNT